MSRSRSAPTTVPRDVFNDAARRGGFTLDEAQANAADILSSGGDSYLAGPPGRGKTWLMDTLVAHCPPGRVRRLHWHEFIGELHRRITEEHGLDDALTSLLSPIDTLCFDELLIDDPADGIFISRLLRATSAHAVRVVVTSNLAPEQQMPNPLFHEQFLPTIAFIEDRLTLIRLDGAVDYRAHGSHDGGFAAGRWLVGEPPVSQGFLSTFDELCARPVDARHYLDLARTHREWTIVGIPPWRMMAREPARRFAYLVDVLYDSDTVTTFLAAEPIPNSPEKELTDPIEARTRSRLRQLTQRCTPRQD